MKFAKERAQIIADQLHRYSVESMVPFGGWKIKNGCYLTPDAADASLEDKTGLPTATHFGTIGGSETTGSDGNVGSFEEWRDFDNKTERWYGPDKHYWFRTELTVPEEMNGKEVWLLVRTQLEEWDDGRNPQFLVFVDGEMIQGLDINHREILLTRNAIGGQKLTIDMQAYTGTLHNEFRLLTDLEVINPKINELYYDIQVPLWGLNRMKENERPRTEIEEVLTQTCNLIDLRVPGSSEFYSSCEDASQYIRKHLYEELAGYDDVIASCIGHTHIDVAWLWTVGQVRQKACRSFATVLKLMDEYPNYHFMSSQPQLYKFVKERHPDEYARIKQRVAEGRWEPEGGMWVEADCNLTSGESLVRQFMYGKRFFKEEFGRDNRILWLPDVFGYNGALPQIMKKCGIDYFMTTKLSWNQFNKIPADTFMWEGIDGTAVFTHFISTLGVGQNVSNFFTTYNGMIHPDAIMGGWERYQNKDINNDILVSYGFGDGGGGPTRTMLETSERMEKGIKGIPKVRQVGPLQYFDELYARCGQSKRLPRWVGELYFEYHRGTLTSMGRNKRANRRSEYRMMELELWSVLADRWASTKYPKQEIDKLWEIILRNQFHDILPGSSIKEVYEVTREEYNVIFEKTAKLIGERLNGLLGTGETVKVLNTLGFDRDDIVELGDDVLGEHIGKDAVLTDGTNTYPLQKTESGAVAFVEKIPSKGWLNLRIADAEPVVNPFCIGENRIETPYYIVTLDNAGRFTSVFDKEAERELLLAGRIGNELRIYEDKPMCFSNWDIDMYYQEKSWSVDNLVSSEWTERGPVRAVLKQKYKVFDTVIEQLVCFYAEDRRIDFKTYVDWKFSEHLMKVHFPLDVHTDEATFDIQFGNVKRKIHKNTSWDVARFESCGHKWADVSEGGYGVSLLNDCKYGYSVIDHNLSLTLIKSGTEPNPETDREEHYFTYSLYPHMGSWQEGGTVHESFMLNVPALALNGADDDTPGVSFMSLDKRNVILETIKQSEDCEDIIVRLYETENTRTRVTLTCADIIDTVTETNLIEEICGEPVCTGKHEYSFTVKPYEIKTFRLKLSHTTK